MICTVYLQSGEATHVELASDSLQGKNLQRSRGQDSGIVDEEIEAAVSLRCDVPSPPLHGIVVGDVAAS